MRIAINELLEKKGKTSYWLSKETGISQYSMLKIVKGETDSIKFENIAKICTALECTPNDIFINEEKAGEK